MDFNVEHAHDMIHSVLVDEEHSAVGGHLDDNIIAKIRQGEYVDFVKLLPRDRIAIEEDNRIQPIFKDGQVIWQTPGESGTVNSYPKWEIAFRGFTKIYTKYHPHCASDLIEYSHDIHAASLTYAWDNVYLYDKEFHLQLSKHLMRSWAVILQHAWNLKMKDRINHNSYPGNGADRSHNGNHQNFDSRFDKNNAGRSKVLKPCKRYNRGKCNYGSSCKYKHWCSYCNKFGHGIVSCRKLNADKDHHWLTGGKDVRKSPEGKVTSFEPDKQQS